MTETHRKFDVELTNRLKTASSFHTHLSHVIAGMNHEIAPWLGGAANTLNRLEAMINGISAETLESDKEKCIKKLEKIVYAVEQSSNILSMLSSSVKRLENYSVVNTSLKDTINSWVKITLTDRLIKNLISENNINIDGDSLDWNVAHSPMLLSQVILNLAKNSIEHNQDSLSDLKVRIYGYPEKKTLVYEDNGKGIPPEIITRVFSPGITSKTESPHTHGLGLSACMDYCISMGASIWVRSEVGKYTRFIIKFEKSYENVRYDGQRSGEFSEVDAMFKLYEEKQALVRRQEQEEESW